MKAQYFSSFLGMTEIKILFKPDSVSKEEFFSYVDEKVVQPKSKERSKRKESKVVEILSNKADMAKYAETVSSKVKRKEQTLEIIKDCLNHCQKSFSKMKRIKTCLNSCIRAIND